MAEIEITGLSQLTEAIDKAGKEVLKAAKKGLRAGGMDIIADAQENLRKNGSIANNKLRASGKVQKDPSDTLGMDVGFFAKEGEGDGYALYVEYGRRAGKMPPVSAFEDWLQVKHSFGKQHKRKSALYAASVFTGLSEEKLRLQAAWAIARSIAQHGTKPHPFFKPAVEKNQMTLIKAIEETEKAVMEKNYGNV